MVDYIKIVVFYSNKKFEKFEYDIHKLMNLLNTLIFDDNIEQVSIYKEKG